MSNRARTTIAQQSSLAGRRTARLPVGRQDHRGKMAVGRMSSVCAWARCKVSWRRSSASLNQRAQERIRSDILLLELDQSVAPAGFRFVLLVCASIVLAWRDGLPMAPQARLQDLPRTRTEAPADAARIGTRVSHCEPELARSDQFSSGGGIRTNFPTWVFSRNAFWA
jgi:hypothetical protein